MKKILINVLAVVMLLNTYSMCIYAKSTSTPSDGEQTVETEDGTIITYNENQLNGSIDLGVPSHVELMIPYQQLEKYNTNAAVSAMMLLNSIGFNYTQQEMNELLKVNDSVSIDGEYLTSVLNHEVENSRYAFTWQQHDATNINGLKKHVVEALSYGNPVLVKTMERNGDSYIEGHAQFGTLYQYGVVNDYFNYGDAVTYTESGYGLYSGFSASHKAGITNLSYAVGGEGYVW